MMHIVHVLMPDIVRNLLTLKFFFCLVQCYVMERIMGHAIERFVTGNSVRQIYQDNVVDSLWFWLILVLTQFRGEL